jgi:hypothetical protein
MIDPENYKDVRRKSRGMCLFLMLTLVLLKSAVAIAQLQSTSPLPERSDQQPREEFDTPLMKAVFAGRVDEVRDLLKSGVNVNEKGPVGFTALMLAVAKGNIAVVKVLLQAGADPNAAGGIAHGGFWSVMIMAMPPRSNRLEIIDMLIAAGGQLNPPRSFPQSPLMTAVQLKDIELINALLIRGANVNWSNSIGTTALQDAVATREPDIDVVRVLLKAGADTNKPRMWEGDECVSLLQMVDERLLMSNNQADREIRDLLRRAGAKRYKRKSQRPCYEQ